MQFLQLELLKAQERRRSSAGPPDLNTSIGCRSQAATTPDRNTSIGGRGQAATAPDRNTTIGGRSQAATTPDRNTTIGGRSHGDRVKTPVVQKPVKEEPKAGRLCFIIIVYKQSMIELSDRYLTFFLFVLVNEP
jgi:hypothetical protein